MVDNWSSLVETAVTQYPLRRYGVLTILDKSENREEMIIAGYASPQVVDREKHVITKKAMATDLPRFMAHPHYRNVNLLHSNVQVGEVIPSWTDSKSGQKYETKVDDVGMFVVVKIRTDPYRPPIVDKVIEDIEQGRIASFSISADAPFESRRHECAGGTCFWVIDEIVLYEVTVCFPGNELVWTKSGLKAIKDIVEGDLVWTHLNRWRPVVRTMQREVSENLVRITTEKGVIRPTSEHPFRVMSYGGRNEGSKYKWVPAGELKAGDLISYHEPTGQCAACRAPLFSTSKTATFCDSACKARKPNRAGKTIASGDPGAISQAEKIRGSKRPGKGGIKTAAGRAIQIAATKTLSFSAKASARAKRQWLDSDYVKAQMSARTVGQNKLEKAFEPVAQTYGFKFVGDGSLIVGGKYPDFWDGGNKLIELYGDFFHEGQDPSDRVRHFASHGYETLVLWESEVKQADMGPVVAEFAGNALVRVISVEPEPYEGTVYNMEVEEDNSYTMKEGVVHNCETPVNQDAKFTVISKSFDEEGEFAASAWCRDGSCSISPPQASRVLKRWRSESGRMLFEGVADTADAPSGLESKKPESAPESPANRLVPEPTVPKFAKSNQSLVHPGVQRMIDREFGKLAKNGVDEFDEGLETESSEHYDSVDGDVNAIANIVRDHLTEDPKYYSKVLAEEGGEEAKLDPASASKLKRAKIVGNSPDAKEMAESVSPKPAYGVAPNAPLADPDAERQYLNLSGDIWASKGSFDLIEGDDNKSEPATQAETKTPKLTDPDNTFTPMVLKDIVQAIEKAIDSVKLSKSVEADARATLAAVRLGSPELTWIPGDRNDFVLWTDSTAFKSDKAYVRLGTLLKSLRDASTSAGKGEALNAAGVARARLQKSIPLRIDQFVPMAEDLVRRATLTPGIPTSTLSGLAKAWGSAVQGDPAAAIDGVRLQLEAALSNGRDDLDSSVLAALDALYEDANSVVDGMVLGRYVKMGETPEHDIIKESGADDTYDDVAKTDALLEKVSKGTAKKDLVQEEKSDTIRGPEDLDGLTNKGGPENLPSGFQERHLEADDPHPGAMIAWFPESGLAQQMAADNGEGADDLHVTIAYLTADAAKDLDDQKVEAALGILRELALEQSPMLGSVGGVGRFSPSKSAGGRSPVVALIDVPGLSEFRAKLVGALRAINIPVDSTHGFSPHITLRYDEAGMDDLDQRGIPKVETSPISIDKLWLVVAGQKFEVSLDSGVGQTAGVEPKQFRKGMPLLVDDQFSTVTVTKSANGETLVRLR